MPTSQPRRPRQTPPRKPRVPEQPPRTRVTATVLPPNSRTVRPPVDRVRHARSVRIAYLAVFAFGLLAVLLFLGVL